MAFDYFNNNSALSNTGSFLTNAVNNMQGRYVPGKGWMSGAQIDTLDKARVNKRTPVPTKTIVDDYERNSKPRRIREYLPTFNSKDPAVINKMYDSINTFEDEKFSSKSKTSSKMSKLLRDLSVKAAPTSAAPTNNNNNNNNTNTTTNNANTTTNNTGTGTKGKNNTGTKGKNNSNSTNLLTKEQFNAQPKVGEQVVVPSAEIPYTGKYSSMENAAIFNNLPSNVTLQEAKKQVPIPVEPGLASSTQFNANDFKRFDDIRALQADQGMSELEATARYGQGMRPNASGLADAVTPNKTPVVPAPVPVQDTTVATVANKVNPYAKDIARLNTAIDKGMKAVDAQDSMKAATGK